MVSAPYISALPPPRPGLGARWCGVWACLTRPGKCVTGSPTSSLFTSQPRQSEEPRARAATFKLERGSEVNRTHSISWKRKSTSGGPATQGPLGRRQLRSPPQLSVPSSLPDAHTVPQPLTTVSEPCSCLDPGDRQTSSVMGEATSHGSRKGSPGNSPT